MVQTVTAQFAKYNHPELKWRSIDSDHFTVHFHQGTELTARSVIAIAEKVYQPITDLYDYYPKGKIHFIIRDHDDYSNGGAYYYDNKIEIWAKPLDFELRGTHNWLWDVVTHEFTHIIQLGASRKGPRWLPGIYFQYIDYEAEARPDVLYGYPNQIMSVPFALTSVPMWFAEGTAQYETKELRNDWWDSHRDMHLRTRALEGNLLTWNQMSVFGKTSLDAESVYNHGFGLVRFIAENWGDGALERLSHALSSPFNISFETASRKTLGISGRELYNRWIKSLKEEYEQRASVISENQVSGEMIFNEGFGNIYPSFSPDGKKIGFLSNKGQDYMSLHAFKIYNLEEKNDDEKVETPDTKIHGKFDWSPDGRYIAYAKQGLPNIKGSHFSDLYLWDFENETEIRLTRDSRLETPSFSSDGRSIVAVHNSGGTHDLALINLPEEIPDRKDIVSIVNWETVTFSPHGRMVISPKFSVDRRNIYTTVLDLDQRSIYSFDLKTREWNPLVLHSSDNRDVIVTADPDVIVFSGDRTGIFNLYRIRISTGEVQPLTNVVGGAFMPDINSEGDIVYSEFENGGFRIRLLKNPVVIDEGLLTYKSSEEQERPALDPVPYYSGESKLYATPFNKLFILPRVAWDYKKFKPGFYFYTSDILDKLTLFSGIAVTQNGERDIYLNCEYNVLMPTVFFEAFNIVRKHSQVFDDQYIILDEYTDENGNTVPIYDKYKSDYKFDLTEVDLGLKIPIYENYDLKGIFRYSKYRAVIKFDDGGSFDYSYQLGKSYILRVDSDQRSPGVGSDIHPKGGFRGWFEYARENNNFLDGFEIETEKGTIVEVYKRYNYHRIESDLDYYWKLLDWLVLNPRIAAGWISDSVDSFYNLYAGGLLGLRGYSYYSIGGRTKAVARTTLRFPLYKNIDKRFGPFYLDRIHGGLFFEGGNAWNGNFDTAELKKDLGGELRFKLFTWYGYPTDIQIAGVYGLDRFNVTDDNDGTITNYGHKWRWYLTVLFDFI